MKVSIIVPVYNEAQHLNEVLEVLHASPCPIEREWLFVDDCSKDNSYKILQEQQSKYNYKLFQLPKNSGKGAAVRYGIEQACGDIIVIQDADFEYNPADVKDLLMPIIENKADIVYGSRFKKNSSQVHRTYHYFVNRFLTFLSNLFSGIYVTDMETCYKIFRADIVKSMNLTSSRFGIEIEFTAYIAKIRCRIWELPISYFPRTRLQGKKINWKDGVAALKHLFHYNFNVSFEEAFKNLPQKYYPNHLAESGKYTSQFGQ